MRKKLGRSTNLVSPSDPPAPEGARIFDAIFPSDTESKTQTLEELLQAIERSCASLKNSELNTLRLALDEALVNAVMHGNKYDADKSVQVSAFAGPARLTVLVTDQGGGFKEEDLPDPDAPENLLEESGRGVILIRGVMDETTYWNGGATLRMVKKLARKNDTQRLRAAAANVPLEQRVSDLEAILSITRAMAAEQDLARLLSLLASACSSVLQVERSSIWVVDPEAGDLFTRVAEKMDAIRVPKGKGIVGAAAADGQPLLIPDAYADARFNPEVDKKSGFRTRQILCYPLKNVEDTRVVGVIQALNKTGGRDFNEYDLQLASIIAAQAGVVLEQAALREQAIEKKRLQAEMDLANSIQQRLLPRESPEIPALNVAGCNRPATETSGDYFDYVTLPDGRLGVIIADVTGHGLGAALIMTSARAFTRALCGSLSNPSNILAAANSLLAKDLESGNFLSFLLAAFDQEGKTLEYASAGHDPPLCYRPSADQFAELESTGPLLGIVDGMEFGLGGPLPLEHGDVLLFMTDGLFECMNANEETMGKDRVREVVRANCKESAAAIVAALLKAVAEWTEGRPPRDDVTIVVVKVR